MLEHENPPLQGATEMWLASSALWRMEFFRMLDKLVYMHDLVDRSEHDRKNQNIALMWLETNLRELEDFEGQDVELLEEMWANVFTALAHRLSLSQQRGVTMQAISVAYFRKVRERAKQLAGSEVPEEGAKPSAVTVAIEKLLAAGKRNDGPYTDSYISDHQELIPVILKLVGLYQGTNDFLRAMKAIVWIPDRGITTKQLRACANLLYQELSIRESMDTEPRRAAPGTVFDYD